LPGVLFQPSVTVFFARGFWRERERERETETETETEAEREIIIDASHDTVLFSVTVSPSPKGWAGAGQSV